VAIVAVINGFSRNPFRPSRMAGNERRPLRQAGRQDEDEKWRPLGRRGERSRSHRVVCRIVTSVREPARKQHRGTEEGEHAASRCQRLPGGGREGNKKAEEAHTSNCAQTHVPS